MTFFSHRRSLRAALAACALLASACTPSARTGIAGPAPEAPAWTAASPAGEIARWMRRECGRPMAVKQPCVERNLVGLIDQAGIGRTMEVLDTLVATDRDVHSNAHALAHGLGIAAYRTPETLSTTFAACPPSQMSGCYHGVVQGYFLSLARQGRLPGTAELDRMCEPHRESTFLYFQCAHGMGHGLMAVHDNHLPMSLEACDLATSDFIRESCYGGVFMENIVRVSHPHHTAEGHAGTQAHGDHGAQPADPHAAHGSGDGDHAAHDAQSADAGHQHEAQSADAGHQHEAQSADAGHQHEAQSADAGHQHEAQSADAGHQHEASAADAGHAQHGAGQQVAMQHGEWRPLDRSEPLYPCTVVAEKYLASCYTMQSSAILFFNGGDVTATARACERAPAAMVSVCFLSLGRDVTALAAQNHARSLELCGRAEGMAGGEGELWCTLGVVQNLVNLAADPSEGMRFCRAVSGETSKRECYRVVGESISTLVAAPAQREASCQAAEPAFVGACRRGAGVEPPVSAGSE